MEQKMRPESSPHRQSLRSSSSDASLIHENYEIISEISTDATGILYKGRCISENRQVAIRLFSGGPVPVGKALDNPIPGVLSIVASLSDAVSTEGAPFSVMEIPRGICLDRLLSQKGALPISSSIQIALNVALLVRALHVHGLVHGHVCAQNIFIRKTRTGPIEVQLLYHQMKGKPAQFNLPWYLSPSLCAGSEVLCSHDDLWAIAVLMHRMLLGQFPFNGDTAEEIQHHVCHSPLELPSQLEAQWPLLVDFLHASLEKVPDDRPDGKELNLVLKSIYASRRGLPDEVVPLSMMAPAEDFPDDSAPISNDRPTIPSAVQKKAAKPIPMWSGEGGISYRNVISMSSPVSKPGYTDNRDIQSARPHAAIFTPDPFPASVMPRVGELSFAILDMDDMQYLTQQKQLKMKRRRVAGMAIAGLILSLVASGGYMLFSHDDGATLNVADEVITADAAVQTVSDIGKSSGTRDNGVSHNVSEHGATSSLTGENVTITPVNVPDKAHVLLNGVRTGQPIIVPKSDEQVVIKVISGDQIIYSTIIAATHDQTVDVKSPRQ